MTNTELASRLRLLAEVYDGKDDIELAHPWLSAYVSSKDEAVALVKAIGGKFDKDMGGGDVTYSTVTLTSHRIAGFTIKLPRDRVCRKTVTWDCEPLLSKDEEAEVEQAIG